MYVLIRKKTSNRYIAAIPVKKGISSSSLKKSLSKRIKSGLTYRLVTDAQLKQVIDRQKPRARPVAKKKVLRRKR